jgi:DNA-binding response OmpR family regulator
MATQRKVLVIAPDVIAPDAGALEPLTRALAEAGFEIARAEALDPVAQADLILIDVRGGANWPSAEQLAEGRTILVVDDVGALRRGFDLGAEDCVMADAHPDEVIARCEAVMRRTELPAGLIPDAEVAVYVDRRLWVNFNSRQVWVSGRSAQLTPREFRLLEHLIQHRDSTLSHDQILEAVWDRPVEGGRPTEVLKQYIWRLRQKIEADPNQPDMIVTDLGAGYRFVSRME